MESIRIYDNRGRSADRYTAVFMYEPYTRDPADPLRVALGMSAEPFHPQGVGMHCSALPGAHLGRRVAFSDCPADVQRCVAQDIGGATPTELETLARHYLTAAVWADCPEGTHPRWTRRAELCALEIAAAFLAHIGPDRVRQIRECSEYGAHPDCGTVAPQFAALGHDLYLTRAGHGVGFADRNELPEELREYLDSLCGWGRPLGESEVDFYRGWLYVIR